MSMELAGALLNMRSQVVSDQRSHEGKTEHSTARHATDGADERGQVRNLRSSVMLPAMVQRQQMPSLDTMSTSTGFVEKPAAPMPAHLQMFDGHRSDTVNHPEDRPRAHHKRGSSQYEMSSESSYRNGPSAESGSSES